MELLDNVVIDEFTQGKIELGKLNIADHFLLSLANFTAELFPTAATYVGAQQQAVEAPALFVDYYSIDNIQQLDNRTVYELGFEITYVPEDELSRLELNSAIFDIQQNVYKIQSDIGEFTCYEKASDITDGLAHVTGIVKAWELGLPNEPIIQIADKEVNI